MQRAFRVGNVDWYSKVKRLGRAPLVLHVFVRRFGLIVKAYLIFGVIKKRLCVYDPSSFVQQRSTWLLIGQENGFLNGQVKRRKDEPSPSEGWFSSTWFLAWWSHQGRFDIIWDCRDPRWRHQLETYSALLALWPVNSPYKGQWRGTLKFSSIYAWTNGWINTRDAGDLRCHRAHYDVTGSVYVQKVFVISWLLLTTK